MAQYGPESIMSHKSLYQRGIQYNSVSTQDLLDLGCNLCYRSDGAYTMQSTDIKSCNGPVLFVGSKLEDSSVFLHGSFAPADIVQSQNVNSASDEFSGVYWHFITGSYFGYSAILGSSQIIADDKTFPGGEFFWRIDRNEDGHKNLHSDGAKYSMSDHSETDQLISDHPSDGHTSHEKFLYNCPGRKSNHFIPNFHLDFP